MLVYQRVKLCPAKSLCLETNKNMTNNSGWWYTYPSEKYEFVSWDYKIPNWMESHSKFHGSEPPTNFFPWEKSWNPKFPGTSQGCSSPNIRFFFPFISNLDFEAAAAQGHKWLPTPIGMRPGAKALSMAWFTRQTNSLPTGKSTF